MNKLTKLLIETSFYELHQADARKSEEIKKLAEGNDALKTKVNDLVKLVSLMDAKIDELKTAIDNKSDRIITRNNIYDVYKNGLSEGENE